MIRLTKTLLLTLAALAATAGTARADFTATASLSGANERPNPNASLAVGFATITYNTAANTLGYSITFTGLSSNPGAGHIHVGGPNAVGPVILPFSGLPAATSGTFSGMLTAANLLPSAANGINTFADAVAAIQNVNAYVNLHTGQFPAGEIRGQLQVTPELATTASFACAGLMLGLLVVRRRRSPAS